MIGKALLVTRHFLDVTDLAADEVRLVLDLAARPPAELGRPLEGQGAALIFEKPSLRTRHSMEMAVVQLGGHPVYTRGEEIGIDVREPVEDVMRILQGYHPCSPPGCSRHEVLERMVAVADVPVVNMLSDHSHPLQALADALTMEQVARPARRPDGRLGRRLQQRRPLARPRSCAAARRPPALRLPVRLRRRRRRAGATRRSLGAAGVAADGPPGRGRRRRRRRALRHVGVDGPGGRQGGPQAGVRGLHRRRRADGAWPRPTPCSCTACRPTAAWR